MNMADEFKFTWDTLSICFPEWREGIKNETFNQEFPSNPNFSNACIQFSYNNDYGIEVRLNQPISKWIQAAPEEIRNPILRMHSDLSHKLYQEIMKDLHVSMPTIDRWREYVAKNTNGIWEGHLQNHIDFEKESFGVKLWDYYKLYINNDSKDNSPTGILQKIQKLPLDSLNEKWQRYAKLAKNSYKEAIIGKDFAECVRNADEIYRIADELKALKFY